MGDHFGIPGAVNLDVQDDLMDNGSKLWIWEPSSNSQCIFYIHLHLNTVEKGMNSPLFLPAMN